MLVGKEPWTIRAQAGNDMMEPQFATTSALYVYCSLKTVQEQAQSTGLIKFRRNPSGN